MSVSRKQVIVRGCKKGLKTADIVVYILGYVFLSLIKSPQVHKFSFTTIAVTADKTLAENESYYNML